MHIQDVLASCVAGFKKQQKPDTTLAAMIQAFEASTQRKQIVAYFLFVLRDVENIFSEDNIMQPQKEEIMFVECNSHNTTAAHKNKKKKTPIVHPSSGTPSSAAAPAIKHPASQVASELPEHPALVSKTSKPKKHQQLALVFKTSKPKNHPDTATSLPPPHPAKNDPTSPSSHVPQQAAAHNANTLHADSVPHSLHKKKKKRKCLEVAAPESVHCAQPPPAIATADLVETAPLLCAQSGTPSAKQTNPATKKKHNKTKQHSSATQPANLDAQGILENAIAQPVRKKPKKAERPSI